MPHQAVPHPAILLLALPLLLSACAAPDAAPAQPAATPHGYVRGAQEHPDPQTGLLTLNARTGEGQLLSLATEETSGAGAGGPVSGAQVDGRYALLTTAAGVRVFDTGAWTVDHGEHKHYYSAQPRPVGELSVPDPGAVAGDGKSIAVASRSAGYASVYRHQDLDAGSLAEASRITMSPQSGMVVPYAGHFIASAADAGSTTAAGVEVRDASDAVVLGRQDCAGLAHHAATRAGVVFACADGALLITGEDGTFAAGKIPYPDGGAGHPPATRLEHRPGSSELAGPAGDSGVWHLDIAARIWTYLPTPVAVVAASAVGDGKRVLAAGVDGSLLALNPATGAVTDRAALLPPGPEHVPQLRVDASRAYISDPSRSQVHEIDYADGLRLARTFGVPAADFLLETGL
ncbi:hypothetical protein [Arthrobacter sp. C152]